MLRDLTDGNLFKRSASVENVINKCRQERNYEAWSMIIRLDNENRKNRIVSTVINACFSFLLFIGVLKYFGYI